MANEMRDRLVELLEQAEGQVNNDVPSLESIADHLIENGVIVPPCKVEDTVYVPWLWGDDTGIAIASVEEIKIYDEQHHIIFFIDMESDNEDFNQCYGGWKLYKSIGETVFLTEGQAEQKLKEMRGE